MDLRPFISHPSQLERARALALRGILCYQPFIFSDTLQTGVGWEFTKGEYDGGLIYWPDCPQEHATNPDFKRLLVQNRELGQFATANQRLRVTYESFANEVCRYLGDISHLTFADVGCNSGYFPLSFAKRGAKQAVGFDKENYTDTYCLLNEILGTHAEFRHSCYDLKSRQISGAETFDVVTSMLTLCHLPDPMNYLACLGRMAKRALFIWNGVSKDPGYSISFGEPSRYYENVSFPDCFDYDTRPSLKLMRKSLELMGFTNIIQLQPVEGGMEMGHYFDKRPILALRPGVGIVQPNQKELEIDANAFVEPELIEAFWNYNIVAFKGRFFAAPHGVPVDWNRDISDGMDGILVGKSIGVLRDRIEWG